ncbi:DUF6544 family protein [Nonomuraea sp. NPDC048916]|uniref:DUF6544 family protein n=1 Tax=Nonomuraea sp. NPDC048916 TaxID=3154232 RepID=UPI0033F04C5E
MTVVVAPPYLTDEARRDWQLLQAATEDPPAFDPAQAELLPEPARRWLLHTIAPGTPLLRGVVLETHGTIRLGGWRTFHATEVLLPMMGFVWTATAYVGLLNVQGFDRYRDGSGEMRWRLLNTVPVMSGTGKDITRSAAGRLASEFVLAPATALDPRIQWKPVDDRQVIARLPVGDEEHEVTLDVAPNGRLTAVTLCRWGNPDQSAYHSHRFGAKCEGEVAFDGFTIPESFRIGWWPGTKRWADGEFIRFSIDDALYR